MLAYDQRLWSRRTVAVWNFALGTMFLGYMVGAACVVVAVLTGYDAVSHVGRVLLRSALVATLFNVGLWIAHHVQWIGAKSSHARARYTNRSREGRALRGVRTAK
jgi:hypothetical protein